MARNDTDHLHQILKDKVLKKSDGDALPEKIFIARDSYLRELYKNELVRSWYYLFSAQILAIVICVLIEDYVGDETEMGTVEILKNGMRGFHLAFVVWVILFMGTLLTFCIFQVWAKFRILINNKKRLLKLWDYFWGACVPCYYFLTLYSISNLIYYFDFSLIMSFTLMVETVRLLMKIHSFIRSSAPQFIYYKPHSDMQAPVKKFSSFLYFLFCPTLLYRDTYPRTTHIRWTFVGHCALELFISALVITYVVKSLCVQPLANFGIKPYTWKSLLVIYFRFAIAGPVFVISMFYFVLDSWQNMFAEITMFADRLFYKDWWNSTNYLRFYKTWNVIVHDWLYEYVYKEMVMYVIPGNKVIARATVISISAGFHEVIIYVALRMFFPVLFILFTFPGTALTFVNVSDHYIWHILFIYGQCFGNTLHLTIYTLGYSARQNNVTLDFAAATSAI